MHMHSAVRSSEISFELLLFSQAACLQPRTIVLECRSDYLRNWRLFCVSNRMWLWNIGMASIISR